VPFALFKKFLLIKKKKKKKNNATSVPTNVANKPQELKALRCQKLKPYKTAT